MIDFVPPHLTGSWEQVLRRRAPLARALAGWLPQRRWFAGKAGVIERVVIEQVYPLDSTATDVALLVVAVNFEGGELHRYNVPVARHPEGFVALGAVIAALDDHQLLYDAMLSEDGCRAVVGSAVPAAIDAPMEPIGVEQSNSSVIVGRTLIAKLVRRLEAGRNPDAELPQLVRAAGFMHAPGVAGTLDVALAGGTAEAVIVHELIPNNGDLWAWMLRALAEQRFTDTTRLAGLLGQRTAELHQALATGEAATATLAWQRRLLKTLRREFSETTRRLVSDTSRHGGEANSSGMRDEMSLTPNLLARFDRLGDTLLDIPLMRVHGDLHLGQVLAIGSDAGEIAIIDFEGEPARSIVERRRLQSPLTDLAGLLRSIDYVGRSFASHGPLTEDQRRRWTDEMSATMTDAYLGHAVGVLPPDPADAALLLDAYLLQKGLYEIRYELANRPDWVGYPLAAVMDMVGQ